MTFIAKLFPVWTPELGAAGMPYTDKYKVTFRGEAVVERSRDPETDLARALRARGYTGTVTLLDGATGKARTIINIEKAARVRTVETGSYPRFRRIETCAGSPPAAETESAGMGALKDKVLVLVTNKGGDW
jgi:hypothetical protein